MHRVLHLSQFDTYGGSARSATKIHEELRRLGAGSRMLVGKKDGDDPDVAEIARSKNWWRADVASYMATDWLSLQYLFSASAFALRVHPWFREASVLQLYNLHGGWFTHTALPLLTRQKPTVWRLSDMWPATGHCAYAFGCERWRSGCGACPQLGSYPPLRRDTTAFNWRVKRAVYRHSPLTLVAPSRWLAGIARESPLLARYPLRVIPNGVETEIFRPRSQAEARVRLDLAPDRPIVLVASREPRKGPGVVMEALARSSVRELTVLVVGEALTELPPPPPGVTLVDLGLVRERERLADVYVAADLLLYPSTADNLPNTVLESMACGTPVVTVAAGGVPEAVTHLEDGYMVAEADAEALAAGVRLLLADRELRERLGRAAADRVRRDYSLERQARAFLDLYDELT